MKQMILTAEIDRMDEVLDFINGELESHDVSMKTIMQIDIAVEELFVNIATVYPARGFCGYFYGNERAVLICTLQCHTIKICCPHTFYYIF